MSDDDHAATTTTDAPVIRSVVESFQHASAPEDFAP
jgi:hypothetical protein